MFVYCMKCLQLVCCINQVHLHFLLLLLSSITYSLEYTQVKLSTMQLQQARRAVAYTCTCGLRTASTSLRFQNPRRWMTEEASSSRPGPSSEVYHSNTEDYHDPAQAQMLTARLAKTKKRMVKRVCRAFLTLETAILIRSICRDKTLWTSLQFKSRLVGCSLCFRPSSFANRVSHLYREGRYVRLTQY